MGPETPPLFDFIMAAHSRRNTLAQAWHMARRYRGPWLRGYCVGKVSTDPAYRTVLNYLSGTAWPVLDIGCGIGLCAAYLRAHGLAAPLRGIDPDERKITAAQKMAAAYSGLTFAVGDALALPPFQGHVIMLDVLHYLPAALQERALQAIAQRVAPGAWALIRATPRDKSWRFRCTQLEEHFVQAVHWIRRGPVHFSPAQEVLAPFTTLGFEATVRPLWGHTPFNSYLFAFQRPVPAGPAPRDELIIPGRSNTAGHVAVTP